MGDKISDGEKSDMQAKIDALKEALKGSNTDEIKTKQEELQKVLYDLSAKLYQQTQPQGDPNAAGPDAAAGGAAANDDGVVDVDYKEVDDDNK